MKRDKIRNTEKNSSKLPQKSPKKEQKEGKSVPNAQKEAKKCSKRGPFYYRFFSTCRISASQIGYRQKCVESAFKIPDGCVEDRRGLCTIYSGLWHFSATFVVNRVEVVGKSLGKSHSYTSRICGQKFLIWVPKSSAELDCSLWYTLGTAGNFGSKRLQSSRRFSSVSLMPACCGAWNGILDDLVVWLAAAGRQPPGSPL